ncbi:Abi family protein [Francisella tularensis subsp. novicida]|uniref:Abi family protein n=3 Tax=Francisella tularensis TaxID=263 RepID=A0A6I4RQ05_FRATU|nr:abortive infection bacteriophage resistance protein [Francisella tularensis subsp. novicida U112]MBK2036630.1 Abi family protein [Francisella tularensis subsp. novicida]MWZ40297.1 Abi family protein [Francisella tularensis]MBK2117170.1 Abi family protein [Francisella tularensis subsp. novicida]MBK2312396.1 Abi family protein [Francisella tularensis subsp. novicida]
MKIENGQLKMKKTLKGWSSYQEQLRILDSRGMQIADTAKAGKYLQNIGYYRLSGYSYVFRQSLNNGEYCFKEQTNFDNVKELYVFDKKLRILVLDAIEIIETSLRSNMSYILGEVDVQAYLNQDFFDLNNSWRKQTFIDLKNKISKNIEDSKKEDFIKHHLDNYDGIPIWVALEVCTFGNLSIMYSLLKPEYAEKIAIEYGFNTKKMFENILKSLSLIRNICSHHGRLWNRQFYSSAQIYPVIKDSSYTSNLRFYYFSIIIDYLLKQILPKTQWKQKLEKLIKNLEKETSLNRGFIKSQIGKK